MRRENTGRTRAEIWAVGLTALLLCLLLFSGRKEEGQKTSSGHSADRQASSKGEPVLFSEDSGFFEEGFTLCLDPGPDQSDKAEIRYTLDGDEPTGDSLLYEGGIDLREAVRLQREEYAAKEAKKAECIRLADRNSAEKAAGDSENVDADNSQNAGADDSQKNTAEAHPTIEEGRDLWEYQKWTAAADSGVRPTRTDDGICVIPVRACLIRGQERSSVVTRTYVIGKDVKSRYDVYVASITTDSANLFDYDAGIMVPGSHYESDIAKGVRADKAGNFYQQGDDWIKKGHVTLFSRDGQVLVEEDTGLSVAGYSSRILPTRTLRMEADKDYGTSDNCFQLDIFSDAGEVFSLKKHDSSEVREESSAEKEENSGAEKTTGKKTGSFDFNVFEKIKFRTHGIPSFHIRSVRNQYAKELTDECGFPGLTENRLGVVFLNGEFYTVCDITPSTTRDYVSRLFGLQIPDKIEKYSGSDVDVYTRTKILRLFTQDLTQEDNQKALEEKVDMDNYLFYFALEVLFNNADWPYNNVTVWRYLGVEDPANPYTDGRIRFLLEDMDQILTNDLHGDPARWSSELVDYLMKDEGSTFSHVMKCPRYRDTFLTYVDDLLATAFEPDHACAILDRLYGEMKREYVLDYGQAFWEEMEDTAAITKQNVREKENLYREDIKKYMGLTDRYEVSIEAGQGADVTWNNMTVSPGQTWTNKYYCGTSFTVTARPEDGYRITGWKVNGKAIQGDGSQGQAVGDGKTKASDGSAESMLTISDGLSRDRKLTVTACTEKCR